MITTTLETLISLELPYRENCLIQKTVIRSDQTGPKVAIVSGIHGDELEGLYVCHRLIQTIEELEAKYPQSVRGRIEFYPALNPLGLDTLQRLVPLYETDLNRNFPGDAQGLFPERMTAAIMESLQGTALAIDIHASNIYLREIPQVRINNDFQNTLIPIAQKMNLDIIWVHGAMTVLEATIAHSLNSRNIPCLVVEMGVGMRITPAYTEQLVIGILHAWKELGVLAAEVELPELSHFPLTADDSNVHYLNADVSGLFVPSADHWTSVKKGELLGKIVSPFHGKTLAEVRSPVSGILFTLREYPLVYEGSLMARLMEVAE